MKKFEKNNLTIALNVLYTKKEKIYPVCASKHSSSCEKQVILLMIRALLRGITSKHQGDFELLSFFCNKKQTTITKKYM